MPGKVNPVIPEAVTQAALLAIAHDQALTMAAAMGSLELNAFMPLIAHSLLESLDLLARACAILRRHCVEGLEADEARCRAQVENGTAAATALLPLLGYERACDLAPARAEGRGLKATARREGYFTAEQFEELTSPEAVGRLGWRRPADERRCSPPPSPSASTSASSAGATWASPPCSTPSPASR